LLVVFLADVRELRTDQLWTCPDAMAALALDRRYREEKLFAPGGVPFHGQQGPGIRRIAQPLHTLAQRNKRFEQLAHFRLRMLRGASNCLGASIVADLGCR